jgi:sulfatase modifying factor 1
MPSALGVGAWTDAGVLCRWQTTKREFGSMRRVGREEKAVWSRVAAGALAVAIAGVGMRSFLSSEDLFFDALTHELRRDSTPRHEWTSIDKRHWQARSTVPEVSLDEIDAREGTRRGCPAGMVRVHGAYHPDRPGLLGEIERIQDSACTDWITREFPARCRTFDREKLASELEHRPTRMVDFCIDRFEYPNAFGQNPMILATFREAEATCRTKHKRLCTEDEWTFACEGEEARPYPYGWTRDAEACVVDRPWRPFSEGALSPRDGKAAREELDRLWQGEPSGSRPSCRSPAGVYDLTGNVDEWTRSTRSTGYASVLKGGYWGPVRARCRPATRAHNEEFIAYQQSFRCCSEPESPDHGELAVRVATQDASVNDDAGPEPPAQPSSPQADAAPPTEDELDELLALERLRPRVGCAVNRTPAESARAAELMLLTIAAMQLRRRRR